MKATALEARLARHCEHAHATSRIDEKLGTLHGIDWSQFVLLKILSDNDQATFTADLAAHLGMTKSRLLMQILPLEKLGLLRRTVNVAPSNGSVALQPCGRRLIQEATETAAALCSETALPSCDSRQS